MFWLKNVAYEAMRKEVATIVAPLSGGLIIIVFLWFMDTTIFKENSMVLTSTVIITGFPLALIVAVSCAIFLQPYLVRRKAFTYLATGGFGLIIGTIIMYITDAIHIEEKLFYTGIAWSTLSAIIYRGLVGKYARQKSISD